MSESNQTPVQEAPDMLYNAIETPDGTVLESNHRHDYKTYKDANGKTYMIDGGLSYIRTSVHEDQTSLALYSNDPHSVLRCFVGWGTYGIDGDQPLSYIKIMDMEDDHLRAVVETCPQMLPALRVLMENELIMRGVSLYV